MNPVVHHSLDQNGAIVFLVQKYAGFYRIGKTYTNQEYSRRYHELQCAAVQVTQLKTECLVFLLSKKYICLYEVICNCWFFSDLRKAVSCRRKVGTSYKTMAFPSLPRCLEWSWVSLCTPKQKKTTETV